MKQTSHNKGYMYPSITNIILIEEKLEAILFKIRNEAGMCTILHFFPMLCLKYWPEQLNKRRRNKSRKGRILVSLFLNAVIFYKRDPNTQEKF